MRAGFGSWRLRCGLIWAAALLASLAATAQHHHPAAGQETVEKPVVFLDKSPRIVAFQLARLSNDQLLLVDRNMSDAKFAPVYLALLTRPGLSAAVREESVAALAVLRKTNPVKELLAALQGLDEKQATVAPELGRMLVSRKPEELKKNQSDLETLAGKEGPAAARRAAFAGLAQLQAPKDLWSFAQDKPAGPAHLLASLVWVPDGQRRVGYFPMAAEALRADADAETRRAAMAASVRMPGKEAAAFAALGQLVSAGVDVPDCARALAALPRDKWPADRLLSLAKALLEQARRVPEGDRASPDFVDITQLGDQLAARLPKESGPALRKAFRSLGVQVLRLRTLHEQMFYDQILLVVEAGKPVELIFENTDVMPHNWVLVKPGALEEIGMAADKMSPTPDSQGRTFVPESPQVLQATKLLNGGEDTRLRFTAPAQPDKYPYVCTFPGHWQRMRGTLVVVKDLDEYFTQAPIEPEAPVFTEWKLADLAPELSRLNSGRNLHKGKELFTSVGCVACHTVGREGVPYGPDLKDVFARYQGKAEAVLTEIIEPSRNLDPRYRPIQFKPADDESFTGFLVREEADALVIQVGPGEASIRKYPKKEITSRQPQSQSLMPAGLLNLLNQEQILDLLAYLQAGGQVPASAARP